MSSIEIYNPEKTTGYVVDEYVNYDRSVYRCRIDTPKPAGAFNDEYWNLVGYILDGSGLVNYSGETTEITFDNPEMFMKVSDNQTISGVKTFTDVIEMTKPEASLSKDSEKVVTIGWVNDTNLSQNVVHRDSEEIITGNKTFNGSTTFNGSNIFTQTIQIQNSENKRTYYGGQAIEFRPVSTSSHGGYIDFHFNGSDEDYTSRLIERTSGEIQYIGSASNTGTTSSSSTTVATKGWANNTTSGINNIVHKSGDETIAGVKSFNDAIRGRFRTIAASQGSDNTNCWFKLGEIKLSSIWNTKHVMFKMFDGSFGGTSLDGTITGKIITRVEGTAGTLNTNNSHITFDMDSSWIDLNNFKLLYKNNQGTSDDYYIQVEFWVKTPAAYRSIMFEIDNEYNGNAIYGRSWTWYDKPTGVASLPSGYTQINALISPNRITSVKNQNTASGTTTNLYDWEGTLAQYNAQNIATTHPEWLCFITDDHTATAYSAYSKTESDNLYLKKTDIDSKFATLLSSMYPKGSIYIGTQATCPMASLISGSTWVLVGKGCSLWGGNGTMYDSTTVGTTAQSKYANAQANTAIEAGLPNITGNVNLGSCFIDGATGAFTADSAKTGASGGGAAGKPDDFTFNASNSNPIYGKSTTVQPPAYVVNVWRRTA